MGRIPAYSPPREEGWLRHKENFGEAHLSCGRRGGQLRSNLRVSGTPSAPTKVASRHFLDVASTPRREEGNTLRFKPCRSSRNNLCIVADRILERSAQAKIRHTGGNSQNGEHQEERGMRHLLVKRAEIP